VTRGKGRRPTVAVALKNTAAALLFFLWMLSLPTGWLYDLGAGVGTGQGQRPDETVPLLRRQEEVAPAFYAQAPVTVAGGELVACPLARLRDPGQAGVHRRRGSYGGRAVFVSEYMTADYPLSPRQRLLQSLVGGYYDRYYLLALEDGSYLCVYFDDYLTLAGGEEYPVGCVRCTTTEERRMLNTMAEDYLVDPVYVLDMYRPGKVSWVVDTLIRLGGLLGAWLVVTTAGEGLRRAGPSARRAGEGTARP